MSAAQPIPLSRAIPFGRPWITDDDRQAVMDVLKGHILTHGPQCKAFEEEFAAFMGDGAHCVSVSSCMAALHLCYFYLGLGPGDEVIVPAETHTATAHAVELVGARPVFVDCDPRTGNIDCSQIESLITDSTKALSLVHFLGIPCNMDEVMAIAARHNLKVVEDCALAIGARYKGKHVGLFGDFGCFSFYPVKHITTGEGGMFVSRHKEVADAVAKLRAFGTDRSHTERATPGMYDVAALGLNYRMSEMQAALGRRQVPKLGEILERRQVNFTKLKSRLSEVEAISILDAVSGDTVSSHYCLTVVLHEDLKEKRDQIVKTLNAAGVGTSIYYPHPVPRMTYYRLKYGYEAAQYPQASAISDRSVALPVGPHVGEDDVEHIAVSVKQAVAEAKA
jgi:dTDP-4-amino-4,6-dideoxygalactose transaminase